MKPKIEPEMQTATIPPQPLPPMIPPAWTVEEVLRHIPKEWGNATIAILDGLDRPYPIKRVTLTVSHNGSLVVLLGPLNEKLREWK